ncbi:hypothetical protein L1987_07887 [Smallanthus sonchifolius]|uniref:Uncharacterized protein n=1 Tax=Smallanthus sonchifolius TaxID=185202 RepID=A0ACB9JJK0_9ASTR|nr:hypothetical protein L1987_07887 [Smallanthus sonchifolius]
MVDPLLSSGSPLSRAKPQTPAVNILRIGTEEYKADDPDELVTPDDYFDLDPSVFLTKASTQMDSSSNNKLRGLS